MEFHPLANIFPLMCEREREDLTADIAEHGLRKPITLWEGKIIDGRNRYLACLKAQVEPKFTTWEGEGDAVAFVVSMNLFRRHLDASQRAMVAGRLAELKQGRPPHLPHLGEASTETTSQNRANGDRPICTFSPQAAGSTQKTGHVTVPQAAALLNVGRRSVLHAREVLEHGDFDLVAAVESGQVSVSDAAKIAAKPVSTQRMALEAVNAGQAKTLSEAAKTLVGWTETGDQEVGPSGTPGAMTDARGRLVDEPYVAIFAARDAFVAIGRQVDALRRTVKEVAASPAGYYLRKELDHLGEKFTQIKYVVTRSAPYAVADGREKEPKWVSEIVWRSLSDEERGMASRPAAQIPRR